jgi:hypothetical protein
MHAVTHHHDRSAAAEPAHELFGLAASLLATARALEVAARTPGTATAVQPTLACLESSLEALAEAAGHLSEHGRAEGAHRVDGTRRAARAVAEQRFKQLAEVLSDAGVACGAARIAAGTVARGESPA